LAKAHRQQSDPRWVVFEEQAADSKLARLEADVERIKQVLHLDDAQAEEDVLKQDFERALNETLDEMAVNYEPVQVNRALVIFGTHDGKIVYNTFKDRLLKYGYRRKDESVRHALQRLIRPYQEKHGLDFFASIAVAAMLTGLLCFTCGDKFDINDFIPALKFLRS
jgi:hypothetical protein